MSRASRYVMLLTGLLLAFPQGWCCAAVTVFVSEPDSAPLQSCCHRQPAPPCERENDNGPLDSPAPRTCCCVIKSTLPPGPKVSTPELEATSVVAFQAEGPLQGLFTATEVAAPIYLSVSPHLLHCVWLC